MYIVSARKKWYAAILEWCRRINHVHSWILTQLSSQQEVGNFSIELMIGQGAGEKFAIKQ